MRRKELISEIRRKKTFLIVGLDPDLDRLPNGIEKTPAGVLAFCKAIIDSTAVHCVGYKLNVAFFEALGVAGFRCMKEVKDHIPSTHLIIADAKRGDIGNSSKMYAKTFFDKFQFDALTVAPYMGKDSVEAFLDYEDRWTILLGLTSNKGSFDFQNLKLEDGSRLFESVLIKSKGWGTADNLMYVIGATKPEEFQGIRGILPEHFLLVPGVGAQGGDLAAICKYGMNSDVGLLINSSRSIIFASDNTDFADAARNEAASISQRMAEFI